MSEMEVDGSGHFFMGPMAVGEAAVHLPGYQGDELGWEKGALHPEDL